MEQICLSNRVMQATRWLELELPVMCRDCRRVSRSADAERTGTCVHHSLPPPALDTHTAWRTVTHHHTTPLPHHYPTVNPHTTPHTTTHSTYHTHNKASVKTTKTET